LGIGKLHTTTKEIIELMQDSLHLDIVKIYKLQKISEKIEHEELDKSEKEFLTKLSSGINEDTIDVRILSRKSKIFTQKLYNRTTFSFAIVLIMYIIAFAVGIILIGFSIKLAFYSTTPNEYLASFFGAAGVFDISFLLYKPAKQIQRSRGNATQLWMAFLEWQYISIWSGKTYRILFDALNGKPSDVLNPKNDPTAFLEQMIKILKMKSKTTVNLIESIEKNVAARPDKKGTKKKKKWKQNGDGKKEDQTGGTTP